MLKETTENKTPLSLSSKTSKLLVMCPSRLFSSSGRVGLMLHGFGRARAFVYLHFRAIYGPFAGQKAIR